MIAAQGRLIIVAVMLAQVWGYTHHFFPPFFFIYLFFVFFFIFKIHLGLCTRKRNNFNILVVYDDDDGWLKCGEGKWIHNAAFSLLKILHNNNNQRSKMYLKKSINSLGCVCLCMRRFSLSVFLPFPPRPHFYLVSGLLCLSRPIHFILDMFQD